MKTLRILVLIFLGGLLVAESAWAQEAPTYTVRDGDTLYSIARRHGLSVEEVQRLNGLEGTTIHPGQVLIVGRAPDVEEAPRPERPAPRERVEVAAPPAADSAAAPDSAAAVPDSAAGAARTRADSLAAPGAEVLYGAHTIEAGETLYGLAARYDISVDTLLALNDSVATYLEAGRVLRLPPSLAVPTHRVAEGETIYDVAARYGVSVRMLERANGLSDRALVPGQRLRIPGRRPPEPAPKGTLPSVDARGPVHVYPASFTGRLTASGQPYDPERFTVSHPDLPFGTVVLLTNPATGAHTFAEVTDRGPLDEGYLLDASEAVARRLGLEGNQRVEVRVMW